MIIGYARVSTEAQELALQLDKLKEYGCDKIFSEKVSTRLERTEKMKAFSILDKGDTSSASGRFQLTVFAALAELERDMIRERTLAGLEAARKRGRVGGRPRGMSKEVVKRCLSAQILVQTGKFSVEEACKQQGLSKSSYYSWLKTLG